MEASRQSLVQQLESLKLMTAGAKRTPTACFRREKLNKFIGGDGPLYHAMCSLFTSRHRILLTFNIIDKTKITGQLGTRLDLLGYLLSH